MFSVSPSDPCEVRPVWASWEMFSFAEEVDIHLGFSLVLSLFFFFFPIGEAVGLVGLLSTAPCYSGGDVMR